MIGLQLASGPKALGAALLLTSAGSKSIARISVLSASGSKEIFNSAGGGGSTATITPAYASGGRASNAAVPITTNQVEISAPEGRAPFTYAWSFVAGSGLWSANNPAAARTAFTCFDVEPDGTYIGTFTGTVTDASGRVFSASVDASVTNYGDLRGDAPIP